MLKQSFILLLVFFGFVSQSYAESQEMKPGKWEMTTITEMPMMGPMTQTVTSCLTKEELQPQVMMQQEENGCTIKNMKNSGATMSWDIVCSGQSREFSGSATATTSAESVKGEIKMKMIMGGQTMNINTQWKGKYLGPCDKK